MTLKERRIHLIALKVFERKRSKDALAVRLLFLRCFLGFGLLCLNLCIGRLRRFRRRLQMQCILQTQSAKEQQSKAV